MEPVLAYVLYGDALTLRWPCPKQTKHGASRRVIRRDAAIGFREVFNTYRTVTRWRMSRCRNARTIALRSAGRETGTNTEREYETRFALETSGGYEGELNLLFYFRSVRAIYNQMKTTKKEGANRNKYINGIQNKSEKTGNRELNCNIAE
jgi:hypothetical protein